MSLISIDKLVILLVEPSSTQQRIIAKHLEGLGVKEMDFSSSAQETLDYLARTKPDVVVSAMHLPDMTGTELLQNIRETEEYIDTPFILISSETAVRYLDPMRQSGVTAILPKPYEVEQLRQALYATVEFLEPSTEEFEDYSMGELRVLVVDDSLTSRRQIAKLLQGLGIQQISEAEDGKSAITLVENEYYDLIVTDYNMPEMDGKELTEYIRTKSSQAGVPIVMITSESDASRLAAVEKSGVSAICDKPFEPSTIKRILKISVLGE